jgi:hypothetical protein
MLTPLRAGLVLLVLSSPALAQTQSLSLGFGGGGSNFTSIPFNQSSCNANDSYVVTWSVSGVSPCGNLQIFVTNNQSCPNGPPNTTGADGGTADIVIGSPSPSDLAAGSGSLPSVRRRDMPGLGGSCPDGEDVTNAICAYLQYNVGGVSGCDGTLTSSTTLTLRYDAKPPVPPGMTLIPQDAKIVIQLDPRSETLLRYDIQFAEAPSDDAGTVVWRQAPSLEATKTSTSISGLTNGVEYLVQAQSVDEVSNLSGYNDPQPATPQASNGFWGEYKDAGGHELGGCSVADAAVPTVFGALGVLIALARRRR